MLVSFAEVSSISLSPICYHLLCSPAPDMTDSSATSNSIFAVIHTSLRLASNSSDMLTMAHLRTLRNDLQATLAIIRGQIQSKGFGTFTKNILMLNNSFKFHRRSQGDN